MISSRSVILVGVAALIGYSAHAQHQHLDGRLSVTSGVALPLGALHQSEAREYLFGNLRTGVSAGLGLSFLISNKWLLGVHLSEKFFGRVGSETEATFLQQYATPNTYQSVKIYPHARTTFAAEIQGGRAVIFGKYRAIVIGGLGAATYYPQQSFNLVRKSVGSNLQDDVKLSAGLRTYWYLQPSFSFQFERQYSGSKVGFVSAVINGGAVSITMNETIEDFYRNTTMATRTFRQPMPIVTFSIGVAGCFPLRKKTDSEAN